MIVENKTATSFQTRMPEELRSFIKEQAALNGRSMNTEINYRLRQAYGLTENAAGAQIGVTTPAAANDNTADEGGASINQDKGTI